MTKLPKRGAITNDRRSSRRSYTARFLKLTAFVFLFCFAIFIALMYRDISNRDDLKVFLEKLLEFEAKEIEFGDVYQVGGVAHVSIVYTIRPRRDSSALLILPYLLNSLTVILKQITLIEFNAAVTLPKYAGNKTVVRLHVPRTVIPITPFLEHFLMLSPTVEFLENGPLFKVAADAYRKRIDSTSANLDLDATISVLGLPSIRFPLKRTIMLDRALQRLGE